MTYPEVTPELLLRGYASGIFPMAESRTAPAVYWVDPTLRGIFPLNGFHISKSLARRIRRDEVTISVDRDFEGVIDGCADRPDTWINPTLRRAYSELFAAGAAHSLEVWRGKALVGGVFGIALGAGFFGESMFSRVTDASKIALAYLVDRLRQGGFTLFDTQFLTEHLASLGAIEIPRDHYRALLSDAILRDADFAAPDIPAAQEMLQRMTHTS
ncbi:MAG: leucyl/phenylalanyl-tRNA--protein transferase [Pseudomonadota bacterium]